MSTLLTTKQAMEFLGYKSNAAFSRAVRREGIPCIRINSKVLRYDRGELERWLKGGVVR